MLVFAVEDGVGRIPRYFQVVLRGEAMDDVPVKISYMFHRELRIAAARRGEAVGTPRSGVD